MTEIVMNKNDLIICDGSAAGDDGKPSATTHKIRWFTLLSDCVKSYMLSMTAG